MWLPTNLGLWIIIALLPGVVSGGQLTTENGYEIHYNATPAELIPPEVARSYQILRSKNRAILTVCVLKSTNQLLNKSVTAKVTAQAVNLNSQLKTIEMREVREGDAIYHIGEFAITNEEVFNFTIKVTPENSDASKEISFRQQFFVD